MDNQHQSPLHVRVTYLEQREPAVLPAVYWGSERVGVERLSRSAYLVMYRRVGTAHGWDQRIKLPAAELDALLDGDALRVYVLRDLRHEAIGFCEFDRSHFPDIELKNFGLIPEVQGRGLGPWLLALALQGEWRTNPRRIWLHTDSWDHPAALGVYLRAGFQIFDERDEPAGPL